jgi:hypothetical protein
MTTKDDLDACAGGISLCKDGCGCMTKTIDGNCGKCKKPKSQETIREQEAARRQMHIEVSNWLDEWERIPKIGSWRHKQGCMLEALATDWNLTRRTEYTQEILRGIASKIK